MYKKPTSVSQVYVIWIYIMLYAPLTSITFLFVNRESIEWHVCSCKSEYQVCVSCDLMSYILDILHAPLIIASIPTHLSWTFTVHTVVLAVSFKPIQHIEQKETRFPQNIYINDVSLSVNKVQSIKSISKDFFLFLLFVYLFSRVVFEMDKIRFHLNTISNNNNSKIQFNVIHRKGKNKKKTVSSSSNIYKYTIHIKKEEKKGILFQLTLKEFVLKNVNWSDFHLIKNTGAQLNLLTLPPSWI